MIKGGKLAVCSVCEAYKWVGSRMFAAFHKKKYLLSLKSNSCRKMDGKFCFVFFFAPEESSHWLVPWSVQRFV